MEKKNSNQWYFKGSFRGPIIQEVRSPALGEVRTAADAIERVRPEAQGSVATREVQWDLEVKGLEERGRL